MPKPKFNDEEFRKIALESKTLIEIARKMGSKGNNTEYIRSRIERLNIPFYSEETHCTSNTGYKYAKPYSDSQIIEAVKQGVNFTTALKFLGLQSGNEKFLKLKIVELNLDVSHWAGGRSYSSPYNKAISIEETFIKNSSVKRDKIRNIILKNNLLEYKCKECDLGPVWQNKSLTLQVDHINGDPTDHRLDNLRFLCPSCHSQTDTYCGKNKKVARKIINKE